MQGEPENIYNLPNAVSILRMLMAPVMIALALLQHPQWFLAAVLFSGFTDVLDGFLARQLDQITEFGSRLDSWGDFTVYTCMAVGAWLLWPDIVVKEIYWFLTIVASFTLPVIVGLIKYRNITSYHTWSVKLAVLITFIGYLLLFSGVDNTLFHVAAILCVVAGIEEILITLLMPNQHVDVRTVMRAWRYHKQHE